MFETKHTTFLSLLSIIYICWSETKWKKNLFTDIAFRFRMYLRRSSMKDKTVFLFFYIKIVALVGVLRSEQKNKTACFFILFLLKTAISPGLETSSLSIDFVLIVPPQAGRRNNHCLKWNGSSAEIQVSTKNGVRNNNMHD